MRGATAAPADAESVCDHALADVQTRNVGGAGERLNELLEAADVLLISVPLGTKTFDALHSRAICGRATIR